MPENDSDASDRQEDENDPHAGETPEEQAARLIGNSSLGTEGAQSIAARASEEDVAEVLRRLHERQAEMEALGEVGPDDFFDTPWAEVDYDNQLSDLIGGGADVDIPEGGTWQELADTLGKLRDGMGNAQPFDADQFDKDVLARYEREKKSAEHPAPRTPESGGQPSMINEGSAILTGIAQNGEVQGSIQSAGEGIRSAAAALQQAIQTLTDQGAAAANAAGGSEGEQLNGAAQSAIAALDTALSQVAMFDTDEVIGQIGVFYNAVSDAAAKHSS